MCLGGHVDRNDTASVVSQSPNPGWTELYSEIDESLTLAIHSAKGPNTSERDATGKGVRNNVGFDGASQPEGRVFLYSELRAYYKPSIN